MIGIRIIYPLLGFELGSPDLEADDTPMCHRALMKSKKSKVLGRWIDGCRVEVILRDCNQKWKKGQDYIAYYELKTCLKSARHEMNWN